MRTAAYAGINTDLGQVIVVLFAPCLNAGLLGLQADTFGRPVRGYLRGYMQWLVSCCPSCSWLLFDAVQEFIAQNVCRYLPAYPCT